MRKRASHPFSSTISHNRKIPRKKTGNVISEHRKIMEKMKILDEIRKQKEKAIEELSNPLKID